MQCDRIIRVAAGVTASYMQLTSVRRSEDAGEAVENRQAVGQGGDLVLNASDDVQDWCLKIRGEYTKVRY